MQYKKKWSENYVFVPNLLPMEKFSMLGYKYISRLPSVTLRPMVLMPPFAFPVMESFSIIIQDVKNDSAVVEEHGTDDQCMMRQD